MAYYGSRFENLYDPPVKYTYDKTKTVTVVQKATYNYMDGLDIRASGQLHTRFAPFIECTSTETKREVSAKSGTLNVVGIQAGIAAFNHQLHGANIAVAATEKTEMATIYYLLGGFFLNPSPIKLLSNKLDKHKNKVTLNKLLLKSGYWKTVNKLSGKKSSVFWNNV